MQYYIDSPSVAYHKVVIKIKRPMGMLISLVALSLNVQGLITRKPQSRRCAFPPERDTMNNVISVIIKRKNEYKRTGKTASSGRREER